MINSQCGQLLLADEACSLLIVFNISNTLRLESTGPVFRHDTADRIVDIE